MYIVIVCDHEITRKNYAICRDKMFIDIIKLYGPFLWMGCNCLKAKQSQYEETVYLFTFYQKFLVLKMKG